MISLLITDCSARRPQPSRPPDSALAHILLESYQPASNMYKGHHVEHTTPLRDQLSAIIARVNIIILNVGSPT
jgi:hypothetical protein